MSSSPDINDLRSYLQLLRRNSELVDIDTEIETVFEISALCRISADGGGPALYFANPKGFDIPVAANLFANRKRVALLLDSEVQNITHEWNKRLSDPIEPKVVSDGACKARVIRDNIDLLKLFPIPFWNERDGGHFITAGVEITKDPETASRNASILRLMVYDKDTMGIDANSRTHLYQQYLKAEKLGKPLPVVIAIGTDPFTFLAAATSFPAGTDEIAMAGGLRRRPIELVRCEEVSLEAPASAEIVIEGEIPPKIRKTEGPFGEVTGYYSPAGDNPIVKVRAITCRENPIFHAATTGRPVLDNQVLNAIQCEAQIIRDCPLQGLKKIHVKESTSSFIAVAQVEKLHDGQGKWFANAILGTYAARPIKYLIIVDTDIDPFNNSQVEWAIAMRSQPSEDILICSDIFGHALDPSIRYKLGREGSVSSKMVIDATKTISPSFPEECRPPPHVLERVNGKVNLSELIEKASQQ